MSQPGIGVELSSHWQGVKEPKARAFRLVPWWVVVACAAAILLSVLIFLRSRLSEQAAPVVAALAVRGVDTGYEAPPPPVPSRLKQLLAEQEQAGALGVEEFGARTVVTLKVPELFQSGSTQVAAGQVPLFNAIGRALEAVPGRILVVGHTDDQPLRSFRYADNFELSRERAIAVAQQQEQAPPAATPSWGRVPRHDRPGRWWGTARRTRGSVWRRARGGRGHAR